METFDCRFTANKEAFSVRLTVTECDAGFLFLGRNGLCGDYKGLQKT